MTNVRMTLSMLPSLEARLLESAARNNEKPSPHACRMIETGLISTRLIDDRDRRLTELASQKAALETRLSQTSSASRKAERRSADLEAIAVQFEQRAAIAENRVRRAERERDEALSKIESSKALAVARQPYPLAPALPVYRRTFADDLPCGAWLQGAIAAVAAMTIALVVAPYDSRFSFGVAELAMGAWGSREKAATHLHGGPLMGGDTMLSAYVLMNTGKNPERLAACFRRADRELAFDASNTSACAIEIPGQMVQYEIITAPAVAPKAGKTGAAASAKQTAGDRAARSAKLAKAASALGRG